MTDTVTPELLAELRRHANDWLDGSEGERSRLPRPGEVEMVAAACPPLVLALLDRIEADAQLLRGCYGDILEAITSEDGLDGGVGEATLDCIAELLGYRPVEFPEAGK